MAFTWLIWSLGPLINHHINVTTSWLIGHKYKTTIVCVFVYFSVTTLLFDFFYLPTINPTIFYGCLSLTSQNSGGCKHNYLMLNISKPKKWSLILGGKGLQTTSVLLGNSCGGQRSLLWCRVLGGGCLHI